MAVRTTIAEVKIVIDTALTDPEITAFISMASLLVDERLGTSTLSSNLLTNIETWLTAHLISVSRERQATDEEMGDAKVKYSGTYGEDFKATSYGQMVLMLDITGSFLKPGKKDLSMKAIKSFE